MDVLTEIMGAAFETFETIKSHSFLVVGIPAMFLTVRSAFQMMEIFMLPPRSSMTDRLELPPISDKKLYVPPLLDLHKCPVSSSCEKCRFCGTDRCLKSYL